MNSNRGTAHPDCGQYKSMDCGICGTKMNVDREVFGPRSWASAMGGGSGAKHDFFYCPHREEDWHKQADKLQLLMESTPSPTLRRIYEKDLDDILSKREKI